MVFAYQASLQAKDLCCQRDQRILFNQLNFELIAGEILLLDGGNGCGKTTLLKILCGFRQADSGALFWNGTAISDTDYLNTLAFVGHSNGHKQELTVRENLSYFQALRKPGHYSQDEALESMKLEGIKDRLVSHLSAGQKRRLALARLLTTNSQLWLLDEPFTSLDKMGISIFETLMNNHIQQGGMIVLTSHHELSLPFKSLKRIQLDLCH